MIINNDEDGSGRGVSVGMKVLYYTGNMRKLEEGDGLGFQWGPFVTAPGSPRPH